MRHLLSVAVPGLFVPSVAADEVSLRLGGKKIQLSPALRERLAGLARETLRRCGPNTRADYAMAKTPVALAAALLLALLYGCHAPIPDSQPVFADKPAMHYPATEYIIAIHPLHNPKRLFEVYQPLVELINDLSAGFTLKFEASRDYGAFEKKLYSRKFHLALPNPHQTIEAERYGYRVVAKMGDDERFRGIIVVRKDSGITSVADLDGQALSFPARTAVAATMMPKFFLHQNGLDLGRADVRYVGSQESAIMNVFLGKTVAAGTWPPPWELFVQRRPELAAQLVVRWQTSPLVNNGVVVRDDVPFAHSQAVIRALLDLHLHERGRAILRGMDLSRFEAADSGTYDPVRKFLVRYRRAFEAGGPGAAE